MKNRCFRIKILAPMTILMMLPSLKLHAELPERPTIEKLCEAAEYIVVARPMIFQTFDSGYLTYQMQTFNVRTVYKGKPGAMDVRCRIDDSVTTRGYFLNIMFLSDMDGMWGSRIFPKYYANVEYVLFLGRQALPNMFLRTDLIESYGELESTPELIEEIESCLDTKGQQPQIFLNDMMKFLDSSLGETGEGDD